MMNKKTGNIITAVVLGLLMLWMSRQVFAQEPPTELEVCDHVYTDDYDLSDLNISGGPTVTISNPEHMTEPYPAYAQIDNIYNWVNGPGASGVPVSLFFDTPIYSTITKTVVITTAFGAWQNGGSLNGFVLISSTGFYTPGTPGLTVTGAQGVASDLWQIGPTNTQSELFGTLMQERVEFSGITGDVIGVLVVSGNYDAMSIASTMIGRWEAEGLCEPEEPITPPVLTCTTVTNADFISGTTGWTATNVITAPSEVIFEAGGQVAQSVATTYTNAITNPGFEANLSGWAESDASNCLTETRSTSEAHSGTGSLLLQRSCDVSRYYYTSNLTTTNTIYTFGAWVKTTGKYKLAVRQTDNTTYSFTPVRTGSGDWEFVTVTAPAKSGTNKVLAYIYFDANTSGTEPVYVDDAMLVSGSSIPTSATVHWIGRSTSIHPVNATVSVGAESAGRQFAGLRQEFYDTVSGDFAGNYDVTVNADQDFALDYLCISLSGSGGTTGEECYTVDDASFEDGEPWTLTSATINGGAVSLSAGGSASQAVSLSSGLQYTVVMSAAFAQAGDLSITLGDHTEEITVPVAASLSYEQAFDVTSGDQLELSSTSGGVSVEYICYNEQTRAYGECLPVIPNGEFDANTDWQYRNGAVWNNVAANAFIPAISGGTFGNVGLGAVGQYPLQGMLPDLLPGEFLILQFDARSIDNGIVTARMRDINLADSVTITATFPTENQYTRYQVPVSQLAGHDGSTMDFGFFNTGLITGTTGTTATDIAVFVDNVCLYLSNEEPQLPVTNPIYGGYNGGLPFTCGTVSQWLHELTGVNFPELETMASPSAWEFSNWVPWLAGRLWVNIGHPIACLLVSLFNSSPFMSIINFLNWLVASALGIIGWLAGWFFSILNNFMAFAGGINNLGKVFLWNIGNIIVWLRENYTNTAAWVWAMIMSVMDIVLSWLNWFKVVFSTMLDRLIYFFEVIGNWFLWVWNNYLTALNWCWDALRQFPGWLWDGLIAVTQWLSGAIIAGVTDLFNVLIQMWNWIAPLFGNMSQIFDTIWQLLQAVGENVIGIVTGLWGTFTTLAVIMFENFSETIGLPMEFYNAFNDAVSSEPFVFIPDCSTGGTLWCNFIFGIQLVNYITGQSIMYPIVIVLIIILTIIVIQKHVWETIKPPGLR